MHTSSSPKPSTGGPPDNLIKNPLDSDDEGRRRHTGTGDPSTGGRVDEKDVGDNLITNPLDKPGASDNLIKNPLDR